MDSYKNDNNGTTIISLFNSTKTTTTSMVTTTDDDFYLDGTEYETTLWLAGEYWFPKLAAILSLIGSTLILAEIYQDYKEQQQYYRPDDNVENSNNTTTNNNNVSRSRRDLRSNSNNSGSISTVSRVLLSMSLGDICFSL